MKKEFTTILVLIIIYIFIFHSILFPPEAIRGFKISVMLFTLILLVYTFNIPLMYKIVIILSIFLIYYNIYKFIFPLILTAIDFGIISTGEQRPNDIDVQKRLYNIFNNNFTFIHNFHKLPDKPSIFVVNYCQDRYENLVSILIPKKLSIVMNKTLRNTFGKFNKNAIYIDSKKKDNYNDLREKIKINNSMGNYIFVYVNKYLYHNNLNDRIKKIHSGAFNIAMELKIPITPICIDSIIINKYGNIPKQRFEVYVGKTEYVNNVTRMRMNMRKFFRDNINRFRSLKFIVN